MYIPDRYRNEDHLQIRKFLKEHAFGILVSCGPEGPMATHLPLVYEDAEAEKGYIRGHFAKANPHWRHLSDGVEVLCIFNGPHSYISSSWYRDEEVPTWNYIAIHVRGRYRMQNTEELWASLRQMVSKYERDSEDPVSLDTMSSDTLRQVRGIVGFEVEVSSLEAAYKLSQGREADHGRIIRELRKRGGGSSDIAEVMDSFEPL